jgi:hypothetical protein
MMLKTVPMLRAAGALLLLSGSIFAAGADSFGAMPGLWKTTYLGVQAEAKPAEPAAQPRWHCVDEKADPWSAFAQLQEPKGYSCKRVSFERTVSSLQWRLECGGPFGFVSEGSLVFDTPKHYSGEVKLDGALMDYPIQARIKVEGVRVAACTSPSD